LGLLFAVSISCFSFAEVRGAVIPDIDACGFVNDGFFSVSTLSSVTRFASVEIFRHTGSFRQLRCRRQLTVFFLSIESRLKCGLVRRRRGWPVAVGNTLHDIQRLPCHWMMGLEL
jgi:hypothetical protein